MISHVVHVLGSRGGHALLGGHGGDGRATVAKVAAITLGQVFFHVPSSDSYPISKWRRDLARIIREIAKTAQDTVLYLTASQLSRQPFVLDDINSLLIRGEVMDLFSVEDKHELNEVMTGCLNVSSLYERKNSQVTAVLWFVFQYVHQQMLNNAGNTIITEVTPTALYERFIQMCRDKLHILVAYNSGEKKAESIFRESPAIVKSTVHIVFKV